jgi:hypothetical protein
MKVTILPFILRHTCTILAALMLQSQNSTGYVVYGGEKKKEWIGSSNQKDGHQSVISVLLDGKKEDMNLTYVSRFGRSVRLLQL